MAYASIRKNVDFAENKARSQLNAFTYTLSTLPFTQVRTIVESSGHHSEDDILKPGAHSATPFPPRFVTRMRMSELSTAGRNHGASTSPAAFAALVIGIACLFSTLLIYSGTVISFLRFEHTELFVGTFAETALLAGTLFGALFVGLSLAGKRLPFMLLGAGGGMLYLCCSLVFVYFTWFGSLGTALLIALSVATAFADVCLALAWGRICARFRIRRALVLVSLASLLSAGICYLYAVLPLPGVTVLFVLSSIIVVIVPLTFAGVAQEEAPSRPNNSERRTASVTIASLADVIVAPGLGLLVFAFVMAVMRTAFNESQDAYLAALAIDAAALLAYTALRKKRFALRGGMHQTFLPLMAMVLLAATSIVASVGSGSAFVSFLTYALYALAAILTLATLCAIANAGEFSSDLVFSTAVLLFCAASFIGQSAAGALGDNLIHVAVTVTTTLYAFVMVLSSYVRRTRELAWTGESDKEAARTAPEHTVDRVELLAAEHRLTTREQEILAYLAEGHSGAYISDVLFISPNTVRTHIHNIYRKLDVSSREDILRLTKG